MLRRAALLPFVIAAAAFTGEADRIAAGEALPLAHYVDSLFAPANEILADETIETCLYDSGALSVDTVGRLAGRLIVELLYDCPGEWCEIGKAILYEDSADLFSLLYHQLHDCAVVHFRPAQVVTADSSEVLYTRSPLPGTGGYVEERYWVWDDSLQKPVSLNQTQVTEEALAQILPEGHNVAFGGFFDINSLSLACYVRKKGDANCCPSGGKVTLKYRIDGSVLKVISKLYDPDDIDPLSRPNQEKDSR